MIHQSLFRCRRLHILDLARVTVFTLMLDCLFHTHTIDIRDPVHCHTFKSYLFWIHPFPLLFLESRFYFVATPFELSWFFYLFWSMLLLLFALFCFVHITTGLYPHQMLFGSINWVNEKHRRTTDVLWCGCTWQNPQPKTVSWNCLIILTSRRNHGLSLHISASLFSQSQLWNSCSLKKH